MVHIVGAGPGAPDLITMRGAELLGQADVVIYTGSLVDPALLGFCCEDAHIYNSAEMTFEEIMKVIEEAEAAVLSTVRLHTGDPCLYGAIGEQIAYFEAHDIVYDITPGVSSFCGAASELGVEYTLPGVSQSVIITRMAGRTAVPERENIASLAAHGATMVIFLSAGMLGELEAELLKGAYTEDIPTALVYKATWPEERIMHCRLDDLAEAGDAAGISSTALVIVGEILEAQGERSKLYDPSFSTGYREAQQ